MRWKLLGSAVVLGAGILALGELRSTTGEVAELRAQLGELRAQVGRARGDAARSALADGHAQASELADSRDPPGAAPVEHDDAQGGEGRQEEPPDPDADRERVERGFQREAVDGAWAGSSRQHLSQMLAAVAARSAASLRDIQCRSSICRVEISHRDADSARSFNEQTFINAEPRIWRGPVLVATAPPGPDGSFVATMYLGREGTQLLTPEP